MERIVAYCGLVCSDCDAYVATQANDMDGLERFAQRMREEFGVADATAQAAMCDGCLTDEGRQIGYCSACEIRACAVERGVVNCGHCTDYPCEKLEVIFAHTTEARQTLDALRRAL